MFILQTKAAAQKQTYTTHRYIAKLQEANIAYGPLNPINYTNYISTTHQYVRYARL